VLGVVGLQFAAVQHRMNSQWRPGGLTTSQQEELTGLADLIVSAQTTEAAVDGELQGLIPPRPRTAGA